MMQRMCNLDSTAIKMLGIKVVEKYCAPTEGKVWVEKEVKLFYSRLKKSCKHEVSQLMYEDKKRKTEDKC